MIIAIIAVSLSSTFHPFHPVFFHPVFLSVKGRRVFPRMPMSSNRIGRYGYMDLRLDWASSSTANAPRIAKTRRIQSSQLFGSSFREGRVLATAAMSNPHKSVWEFALDAVMVEPRAPRTALRKDKLSSS